MVLISLYIVTAQINIGGCNYYILSLLQCDKWVKIIILCNNKNKSINHLLLNFNLFV